MIEVRFHEGGYPTGWYRCALCTASFKVQLEDPLLVAHRDGERLGEVCPECLATPVFNMVGRANQLMEEAKQLLEKVSWFKEEVRCPTLEEYREKRRAIAESLLGAE